MSAFIYKTLDVALGETRYDVVIGRGVATDIAAVLANKTKDKKALIVADRFFSETLVPRLRSALEKEGFFVLCHSFDAGKGNKNFNEALKIYGVLEENDLARDSTVIAVGGGVIGDLAGFVASTWYRGMNLVHIPTSLMAMVDSSIGGKVAINFRDTINAVGNYYHPIVNIIDLDLVDTLPERDYKSGLAEVIKVAVINDLEFFEYLSENSKTILSRDEMAVVNFISRSIEIKVDHVNGDVREGSKRLLLNYGHTLGHSIEISTVINGHESYRHGEGVAIGIMAVLHVAEGFLSVDDSVKTKVTSLLKEYGLPTSVDTDFLGLDRERLLAACLRNVMKDKKRKDSKLRLILAPKLGAAGVYSDVPFSIIEEAFEKVVN